MRRWAIGLGAVAALAGAWLWWTGDERRLVRRLAEMERLFEKEAPEDQLESFGRTRQIVGMFAPGFLVLARPYEGSVSDLQQLAAIVQRYRDSSDRISIDDSGRRVAVDAARGTAETSALFAISGGSGSGSERFRARIAWVRLDGEWKIQEIEILEVLERGALGL